MIKNLYRILAMMMLAVAAGCIYDYEPEDGDIQGLDEPLVVIDGDIIVGGVTRVKVGFTQPLTADEDSIVVVPLGASVWVESEAGEVLSGRELEDNVFEINTEDLSLQGRYRLGVSIPGRGEYRSAFKGVLVSPAIDSVTYSVAGDRSYARIEVSTHNDATSTKGNGTRDYLYCKWNYLENWESNAIYPAQLEFDVKSGKMNKLGLDASVARQYCFCEAESSGTYIANTEKLYENVISKSVVKEIPNTDSRLMGIYSVLVKQTALDKEAYIYWENIKNNTSGTGGLFGPQPSEIRGNIVSATTAGEIVIGYVNVSTVSKMRLFVDWSREVIFSTECVEELVPKVMQPDKPDAEPQPLWPRYYSQGYRPVRFNGENEEEAYWAMEKCTDCRVYSNSTKPDFWPR